MTGDYSKGAQGVWIENGRLTHPVHEVTIAGNILDMMQNITAIGNNLTFDRRVSSPTFLVRDMVVSGN